MRLSPTPRAEKQFSCDTLVALGGLGDVRMVFGKNSDRPMDEAQPLESAPRQSFPAGASLRCQYLTIPQTTETFAVLGSRPWWMWGYEHGVNEAGVAIGNEAIYTHDEVPDVGLTGMDLVRLGLERGATAAEAQEVITGLVEEYGQGGDALYLQPTRYHNSFIIADGREAYVLETSSRNWVSKRLRTSAAIGNLLTIEDDWDSCSDGLEAHARANHWWWGPTSRKLDFRAAFEDGSVREKTEARYEASRRFLAGPEACSVESMFRHLRDHFEGGTVHIPEAPGEPRPRSVCCHPGRFASATAASMVVELAEDKSAPPIAWCSMTTPCTSVFLPIRVGDELPPELTIGGQREDSESLWWTLYRLARLVERDPATLTPPVQEVWSSCEAEFLDTIASDPSGVVSRLGTLSDEAYAHAAGLIERLEDRVVAVQ